MQKAIETVHQINAPIDRVWALIESGAKWEDWFSILKDSRVEGSSRFCDLENGDVLEEKFLASQAQKTFIYNVHKQASFPAENIVAAMRLEANGVKETRLYWTVDLEVADEETFEGLKGQISHLYAEAAAKLQVLANAKAAA